MTSVNIETNHGNISFNLLPDLAPEHVRSFVKLAKEGFYDGTLFHRVIPGFMIQGGDPDTKDLNKQDQWGGGGPGYTIKAEFNSRSHLRGIVSAARATDPDSAGSQFFIMHANNTGLDHLYSVFGEVIDGMDIVDKIVMVPNGGPNLGNRIISNFEDAKILKVTVSE